MIIIQKRASFFFLLLLFLALFHIAETFHLNCLEGLLLSACVFALPTSHDLTDICTQKMNRRPKLIQKRIFRFLFFPIY